MNMNMNMNPLSSSLSLSSSYSSLPSLSHHRMIQNEDEAVAAAAVGSIENGDSAEEEKRSIIVNEDAATNGTRASLCSSQDVVAFDTKSLPISTTTTVATTSTESSYSLSSSSSFGSDVDGDMDVNDNSDNNINVDVEVGNRLLSFRKVLGVDDEDDNMDDDKKRSSSFPKIVGHRGCLYEELENTRPGFMKCYDMGCTAVELDVFKIKNGSHNGTELIVFHGGGSDQNPGDLQDYCNVTGSILDCDYQTIISQKNPLTFNTQHQEFPCPIHKIRKGQIPTLQEVLLDVKHYNNNHANHKNNTTTHKMQIKIELKGPDVTQDVLTLVDALEMVDVCSYSSFDLAKLRVVRELKPQRNPRKPNEYLYRTGALFNNVDRQTGQILDDYKYGSHQGGGDTRITIIDRAFEYKVSEIHLKYDTCSRTLVQQIHAAGLSSMAWFRGPMGMHDDLTNKYYTDNHDTDTDTDGSSRTRTRSNFKEEDSTLYETLIKTGVEQLCVNKPHLLIQLRNKYNSNNNNNNN